jgi:hypothetical protein
VWRYARSALIVVGVLAVLAYFTNRIVPAIVALIALVTVMKQQLGATLTITSDGVSMKMGRRDITYKWTDVSRFQVTRSMTPQIGVVFSEDYRGGSELRRAAVRRLWGVDALLGGIWEIPTANLVEQLNKARDAWAGSATVPATPVTASMSETDVSTASAHPVVGELLGVLARIVSWADVLAAFVMAGGILAAERAGNLRGVLATTGFFALSVFNCLVLRKALRKAPQKADSATAAPNNLISTQQRVIGFFGNGFAIAFFAVYTPFLANQGYAGVARMSVLFVGLAVANLYLIATAARAAH